MAAKFIKYGFEDGDGTLSSAETFVIQFDRPVMGVDLGDFIAKGVSISDLTKVNDTTFTMTLTPIPGFSGSGFINMNFGSYTDANGALGSGQLTTFGVEAKDTTAPDAAATQISLDAVTVDNAVNKAESEQTVNITGKVTGEFQTGDTVIVTVGDQPYTTTVVADGSFMAIVAGSALAANASGAMTATVLASDEAGNVAEAGVIATSKPYTVDTIVTGELTLNDFTDSASSYVVGSQNDGVSNDNTFTLGMANSEDGLQITYQVKQNGVWVDTTINQTDLADGIYQYQALLTDKAGNTSTSGPITITVDTTPNAAPTGVMIEDDSVVGKADAGSTVVLQNDAGTVLAHVVVDGDGNFSFEGVDTSGGLTVASIDLAGNSSEVVAPGKHLKVYTAASDWSAAHGPVDYYSLNTSNGDDWLEIGNGTKNCWTCGTQGNIWNPYPWTGYATIATGAGNDRIDTGVSGGYGNMYAYTSVDMGSGDDTFNLKGQMYSNSIVDMGIGDDVINIGGNAHNHAEIYAGEGNDTLTVGEDIDDYAKVSMGAGNDTVTVGEDIEGKAQVALGDGNDSLTVAYDVEGRSSIDTGAGNDTITIGEDVEDYVHINMGAGNDVLSVARFVENETVIDMGDGDNTATMAGLNNWASISFGSGDDSLTVTHQFGVGVGYASASLGAGDDTFTFGGTTLDGVVNGGSGLDTLVLTYNQSDIATSRCCHETNLTSHNFTGFELIDMQGNNAVDIRYSDLVQDTTRDGALFIKGDANSKVDMGSTDWNSDTDTNLADASGGHWTATGSSVVDGVVYDVYHHSYATDTSNDVYIQQGVVVI